MASPFMTLCSLEKSHFDRKPIWAAGLTLVGVKNLPTISAGRFTRLAAHFANNDA
jgi:hypothetical protein